MRRKSAIVFWIACTVAVGATATFYWLPWLGDLTGMGDRLLGAVGPLLTLFVVAILVAVGAAWDWIEAV